MCVTGCADGRCKMSYYIAVGIFLVVLIGIWQVLTDNEDITK